MSTDMLDIGYEDHLWRVEVKKRYDRRYLLEMKLKLDDSDGDKSINVNAKISKFSSFSGHLDGQGVLDYLTDMKINKSVFLTHGEYDGMLELKESIEGLNMNCEIPDYEWELSIK